MARQAGPAGADLLKEVERLAGEGYGKGEIAERLGLGRPSVAARTWELHGGKRHNGAPDYPVRIHRTGERRERCAVYRAL